MKKFINSKRTILALAVILTLAGGMEMVSSVSAAAKLPTVIPKGDMSYGAGNFYQSNKVQHQKVSFKNIYNMKVVGNLYLPKNYQQGEKLPAIVVGHPMGAVKEQSASLYAQKMAEAGYAAMAIDLSYWGESEGKPRNSVNPDTYAEDFSAAVDFLGTRDFVNRDSIGVIGICGSGSFAISAAKIDPRMKAIATVSMYNMGDANRHGLNKSLTLEQRQAIIAEAAEKRYNEFLGGAKEYTSGTEHELTKDTHPIQKEFYEFYRTTRGSYTTPGENPETTTHPTLTSNTKFMNFYPFVDIETISPRPMLFITGETAHSKEFSEDAYKRAVEPKELYYVKDAGHVDLYDRVDYIPFAKLISFFDKALK